MEWVCKRWSMIMHTKKCALMHAKTVMYVKKEISIGVEYVVWMIY